MSKNLQSFSIVTFILIAFTASASQLHAQRPSLQELIQNVDRAAEDPNEPRSFLGFQRVKMPKALDGLVDLRFRKPTLPKFGFLEKLKNIGNPSLDGEPSTKGPFLAGLGKLFSPQPKSTPGFFGRLFGRQPESAAGDSLLTNRDMQELNGIAQGLQSQAQRMSEEAKNNMRDLFAPNSGTPQPPYRTARQYQDGTSRY